MCIRDRTLTAPLPPPPRLWRSTPPAPSAPAHRSIRPLQEAIHTLLTAAFTVASACHTCAAPRRVTSASRLRRALPRRVTSVSRLRRAAPRRVTSASRLRRALPRRVTSCYIVLHHARVTLARTQGASYVTNAPCGGESGAAPA
eukprot:5090079-Pyramimonas_sp.AAC.3